MPRQKRDSIAAYLDRAVAAGGSSEEVAALVMTTFGGISQALGPILGERGMAAIFKRSIHLSRSVHPWLPSADESAKLETDFAPLETALATRTSADAAAAGTQLLDSFS